ncbi:MAG: PD40 domain-containing protein, partial [Myxococcales bacterium]|nr:PD40 domain-containing protein [Myxococcales bacterium]
MIALLWTLAAVAEPRRGDHHDAGTHWHTIDTRFFRVHYASRGGRRAHDARGTAEEVAAVADALLLRISAHVGAVPRGPIHVVVTDEAEGMTAWTMTGWGLIVLSSDPGGEVARLRGRLDWVPDALAHELGHLVGHRRASALAVSGSYGFEADATAEVGGAGLSVAVPVGPDEPYGWSEGAAEAWSEAIGVNRWDARREARLRTAALEGRLLEWDEWLVSLDKDVGDAERAYQQGYAFARWLEGRFGEDVFARMAELAAERYPLDWGRLLRRATGEEPRLLWAAWRAEVTSEAVAWEARARGRGLTEGREVESWLGGWDPSASLSARDAWLSRSRRDREEAREATGSFDLWPSMSADGRWYAEEKVGWVRVARVDEEDLPGLADDATTPPSAWIPAARASGYAFVPGRDAIVVAAPQDVLRHRLAPRLADPWTVLWVVDLGTRIGVDGGVTVLPNTRRELLQRMWPIAGTERARDPDVSPDGLRVVWLAHRDRKTDLVVAGIDGSDRRVVRTFADGEWIEGPSFSPDGASVVVSVFAEGRGDLWVVDLESGGWRQLTDDARDELDPVWTEAGVWAAVEGESAWDVVRFDPSTGEGTRITRVLGSADTPWVTPSGHVLYAEGGAHGKKATVLRAGDLLLAPDEPFTPESAAPIPRATPAEPHGYRPLASLLVPAVGPLVRVDAAEGGVVPAAGGWLRVSDAAELFELSSFGLLGTTSVGDAVLAWRGLPPELEVEVAGAVSPSLDASVGSASLTAGFRWTDQVRVELGPARVASRGGALPDTTSWRGIAAVHAGDGPDGDPGYRGTWADLVGTVGLSDSEGATTTWGRGELELGAGLPVDLSSGPLSE